jgi:hypothetical protein
MKKVLLITIALLTFAAAMAAAADNIDIQWTNVCRIAGNNATLALNNQSGTVGGIPCDDSSDPMGAAPTKRLNMQLTPGTTLPDFSGVTTQIEFTSPAGFANGSIWDWSAVGCNPGAISAVPTIAAIGTCVNPFLGDTQGNASNINFTNTKIVYINNRVRNTTIAALNAGTTYVADGANIDFDSGGQTQSCAGCGQVVDVFLSSIKYFSPGTEIKAQTPGLRVNPGPCIGWNDAAPTCAGATPTQRSTWGSVKALYR